jgi:predicted ATPase
MRRYVLTGAPGAGKTSVLHLLRERGWAVIDEAATDVIAEQQAAGLAEPWTVEGFTDAIAGRQRDRQLPPVPEGVQVFDRSPFCTLALARYLGHRVGPGLAAEIDRATQERTYEPSVFLVRPLGFFTPTAARRIGYQESLDFEAVHEQVYLEYGFDLVEVPVGDVAQRADLIETYLLRSTD